MTLLTASTRGEIAISANELNRQGTEVQVFNCMRGLEYFNALTSVSLTPTTSMLSLNPWATFSSMALLSRCSDASSCKVFAISEIMSLICRFVDRADRVRLMLVSRLLFYCAMPLVWYKVTGAANIIVLLSGVVLDVLGRGDSTAQKDLRHRWYVNRLHL
jgi:hypothetical protein